MKAINKIEKTIILTVSDIRDNHHHIPNNELNIYSFNIYNDLIKKSELIIFIDGDFVKIIKSRYF